MGFAEGEEWWEQWQLRVLVLGSLALQFFLVVAAALRKRRVPPWFRFLVWTAYLGSDALAIYALATLFNRQRMMPGGALPSPRGTMAMEALWAPILLLHLGGQDGITAYSLQDNELWRRHLFTAASQVGIAIYVFRKSWPGGEKRLLQAAILLFVPGVVKCLEKPFALWRSSLKSMVVAVGGSERGSHQPTMAAWLHNHEVISKLASAASACLANILGCELTPRKDDPANSIDGSLDKFVKAAALVYAAGAEHASKPAASSSSSQGIIRSICARRFIMCCKPDDDVQDQVCKLHDDKKVKLLHHPYHLFVDLPYTYSVRRDNLEYLLRSGAEQAHVLVRSCLSRTFDRLYTNYRDVTTGAILLRAVLVLLTFVAIPLVVFTISTSTSQGEGGADVTVTYVLLCCTAALELISPIALLYMRHMRNPPWPDHVAQCSLIEYLIQNERHGWAWRLACWLLGCKAYLDWLWCTAPSRSSTASPDGITRLVHAHISTQWRERHIKDEASYRSFSNSRGKWTLDKEWATLLQNKEGCSSNKGLIESSLLQRPFDESVVVWHLATEFCFASRVGLGHHGGSKKEEDYQSHCREISNYMVYLLLVNPAMLMPGARRRIFTVAYAQVREMLVRRHRKQEPAAVAKDLKDDDEPPEDRDDLAKKKVPRGEKHDIVRIIIQKVRVAIKQHQDIDLLAKKKKEEEDLAKKNNEEEEEDSAAKKKKEEDDLAKRSCLIRDAWKLAEQLMAISRGDDDNKEMWRVIRGVWVEMLCFSASRCRGYLHAKSLATGGEYLSYVWLLREYMGMETLPHTIQNNTAEEPDTAAAPAVKKSKEGERDTAGAGDAAAAADQPAGDGHGDK